MTGTSDRDNRALVVHLPEWVPPLLDFILIMVAFLLAHYVRYELQLLRPVDEAFRAPFEPFIGTDRQGDSLCDVKARLLAHVLDLVHEFTRKTFVH